jgi:hypothetical protein
MEYLLSEKWLRTANRQNPTGTTWMMLILKRYVSGGENVKTKTKTEIIDE